MLSKSSSLAQLADVQRLANAQPEIPYILLRTAYALFGKALNELDDAERHHALQHAQREYRIETQILRAPEAAAVIVTEEQIVRALATIRERYADDDSFAEDLMRNNLDWSTLRLALLRQCKLESVLEKIAADAPSATEVDISIFYHSHLSRFSVPETRNAHHILITINDDQIAAKNSNSRTEALARIQSIAQQLAKKPYRFAELAQRYSECPTALQGGHIGPVKRGQLYQVLEEALFQIKENEIGGPLESPMGLHLIKYDAIQRAHSVSLRDASPGIRRYLNQRLKESQQKRWIASLPEVEPVP